MINLFELIAKARSDDHALQLVATGLQDYFGAYSCDILFLTDSGSLVVKASTAQPDLVDRMRVGRGVGLAGHVCQSGQVIVVRKDLPLHPLFAHWPGIDAPNAEAAVSFPIMCGSKVTGAVTLEWFGPLKSSVSQSECHKLGVDLGSAYQVFIGGLEAGSQANRLGLLAEVTDTLSGTPYLEEILQHLVNITARRFNYRVVSLRLLDDTKESLILRAAYSHHRAYPRRPVIRLGESIAGKVIQRQKPIVVLDVQTEPEFIGHDLAIEQGLRSMVCVPLRLYDAAVGVMSCYTGEIREFPADEVATLVTMAKQAAVAIEHAKSQVKHTLLQEMHHRVKNNLQQVASLLRLQARQSHYKTLDEALNDSLSRIEAIAAVHDLLGREDLDHVGLRTLTETLVMHQAQSLVRPDRKIEFSVRGQDVNLPTNQATQVALVVNELIQNAVTHGFQSKTTGDIHVTIEESDETVQLWVSNNGDPLPSEGARLKGRLGLSIIEGLTRSLGGSFQLETKLGWTVAHVTFLKTSGE